MRSGGSGPGGAPELGAPKEEGFPRERRVVLPGEIRGLIARGKRRRTSRLDVFFSASPALYSRIGFIVPKHRHKIVERNRLKRRLREIGRREVLRLLDGSTKPWDVVVRARPAAYDAAFSQLRREMIEVSETITQRPEGRP